MFRKLIIILSALILQGCLIDIGPPSPRPDVYCDTNWDCPVDSYCGHDGFCYTTIEPVHCHHDLDCPMHFYCGADDYCHSTPEFAESSQHSQCYSLYDCPTGYYCGRDGYCYHEH